VGDPDSLGGPQWRLKGLTGVKFDAALDEVLQSVRLLDVKNKSCGKFSGGAYLRLDNVACNHVA
jgi:hypothetical protein